MASTQNLASGILSADINSSATSISVSCGTGSASTLTGVWPSTPFFITVMPSVPVSGVANSLDSEVMKVTAISASNNVVSMTVARGQKNTTAKSFSSGAIVTNGIYMDDILDRIYPVGSIYTSATLSTTSQVESALGGTWSAVDDYQLVAYASLTDETTIGASKNISSITGSDGEYTVNFSKNMADTNYVAFVSGEIGGTGQEIIGIFAKTVSKFMYDFTNYEGTKVSPAFVDIAVFGKLANPEKYVYKRTA